MGGLISAACCRCALLQHPDRLTSLRSEWRWRWWVGVKRYREASCSNVESPCATPGTDSAQTVHKVTLNLGDWATGENIKVHRHDEERKKNKSRTRYCYQTSLLGKHTAVNKPLATTTLPCARIGLHIGKNRYLYAPSSQVVLSTCSWL